MKENKILLTINYDFPPAGGAGVKRCLKFMKYLPDYGWDLIVLTVQNGNHSLMDPSLLNDICRGVSIYRTRSLEALFNNKPNATSCTHKNINDVTGTLESTARSWLKKIYKYFGTYCKVPDSRILWLPTAVNMSLKLNKKRPFDVIYATGPTFVNLIVASIIKVLSKKPLVIDFRDAWISDPMLVVQTKKYLFKLHQMLEKFVIKQADKVIATNPFVTQDFQKRYFYLDSSKFITIYNGYDIEDFPTLYVESQGDEKKFTIVYTGRLYAERNPKFFLKALKMALDEEDEMRDMLKVIFVGSCEEFIDGKNIQDYIKEYELEDIIELTGHVSRKKSLQYQTQASILLMIIGIVPPNMELTYGLSGKIFDYMLSRKPILTLANGGATREFIVDNNIGHIYYHEDVFGIKNYLIESYKKYSAGKLEANYNIESLQRFNFKSLTEKLSKHFNDTVQNK
jgi:glycosyltransferase involved in cell wall biosynthesis